MAGELHELRLVFVYHETDRIECAEKSARCYRVGLTDVAGINRG